MKNNPEQALIRHAIWLATIASQKDRPMNERINAYHDAVKWLNILKINWDYIANDFSDIEEAIAKSKNK